MKNALITGTAGFIGSALCNQLSTKSEVIGVDTAKDPDKSTNNSWEQTDLTDGNSVIAICEKHSPDVVVHCAGIAHQKIGSVDYETYIKVNSEATDHLAKATAWNNPDVLFIFLSSISVYDEGPRIHPQITQITQNEKDAKQNDGVGEDADCNPSSDYAFSKLDAEKRLVALYDEGLLRNLIILRLSPVYVREWSLNLDRIKGIFTHFGSKPLWVIV